MSDRSGAPSDDGSPAVALDVPLHVERALRAAYERLADATARARTAVVDGAGTRADDHERRRHAVAAGFADRLARIEAGSRVQTESLRCSRAGVEARLADRIGVIAALAPWAVATFDDPVWADYRPSRAAIRPTCVRIGAPAAGPAGVPALVPVSSGRHLAIVADGDGLALAEATAAGVVLRLVASAEPGTVRLALADAHGQGRGFSAFLTLPASMRVGDRVAVSDREVAELLDRLEQYVVDVVQTRLTTVHADLDAYNAATTGLRVPHHVLALHGFPTGFDERTAGRLVWLARHGPRAGLHLVVTVDASAPYPRGVSPADLTATAITMRCTGSRVTTDDPDLPDREIVPDPAPDPRQVRAWLTAIAQTVVPDTLPFDRIATDVADRWAGDSTDGLDVQIGADSRGEPHRLVLGRDGVQHALIGGDTQMGKSNLIQVLLTQLALRYPPEELELYLLDFKEVEFTRFLTDPLPHARVVGTAADREFGVGALRRFRAEIDRRRALFARVGAVTLRGYRQTTGDRLPRVLAVVDEFQMLFPEHDRLSTEAGSLLGDVARRGAGFGLHLLLASQAPHTGEAATYLRQMYDQMRVRIALGCSRPGVSYALLGEGNDAATQLQRPGDAVHSVGDGRGTRIRIADIPHADRAAWSRTISELAGDRRYPAPASFDPSAAAHLADHPSAAELLARPDWPSPGVTVDLWLGEPVDPTDVEPVCLERYLRSNLLVVGGERAAHRLLASALLSVAVQRSPTDVAFVVAEFARPSSEVRGFFTALSTGLPHGVEVVGPRAAAEALGRLIGLLDERVDVGPTDLPTRVFFVAGLHRWPDLEGRLGQPTETVQQLTRLLDEGPEVGIHVVLWSETAGAVERVLGRDGLRLFHLRAAVRVQEADSLAVMGSPAAARLQDDRVLVRTADSEPGHATKFKIHALPSPEAFASLGRRPAAAGS